MFAVSLLLVLPAALPQEALLESGASVPGLGTITKVHEVVTADDGGWLAFASGTTGVGWVRDGVLWNKLGAPVPAPAGVTLVSAAVRFDGAGRVAWEALGSSSTGVVLGVYLDSAGLRWSGAPCLAPQVPAGTTYNLLGDGGVNGAGTTAAVGQLDLAGSPLAAVVLLRVDATGALASEDVHVKAGDAVPGIAGTIAFLEEAAVDDQERVLYTAHFTGSPASYPSIVFDGAPLAVIGQPTPDPGTTWLKLVAPRLANGWHSYQGLTFDGSVERWVLVRNGVIVAREGDTLPDIAPATLAEPLLAMEDHDVADDGTIAWIGAWGSSARGLFVNDQLLLKKGDVLNGRVVHAVGRPDLDRAGDRVAVNVAFTDSSSGAYRFEIGGSVTSVAGCTAPAAALVHAFGEPKPGGVLGLTLDHAQAAGAMTFLAASLGPAAAPCGTLVPGIGELLLDLSPPNPIATLGGPAWTGAPTPFGIPIPPEIGVIVTVQGLFVSPATPAEPFRVSNALEIVLGY